MRLVLLGTAFLLPTSACTTDVLLGEQGVVGVVAGDLRSVRLLSHNSDMPVLVGSSTEASLQIKEGPPYCYNTSLVGAAWAGDRLIFDTVGAALFTFEPTGCQELPDAPPDRLTMQVVGLPAVRARVALPEIEWGLRSLGGDNITLVHPDQVPDNLVPDTDTQLVLVAGTAVEIDVAIELDGHPVLVGPGAGALQATGDAILGLSHPLSGVLLAAGQGQGEISFQAGDQRVVAARFDVIQPRQVRRLRHAVLMNHPDGVENMASVTVWGVDNAGRRVHGLPLETEVTAGPLVVSANPHFGPYLYQPTACTPPWELAGQVVERSVRLRFDKRKIDVDLRFDMTAYAPTPEEMAEERATWTRNPSCVEQGFAEPRGCACSAGSAAGGAWLWPLGVLFLVTYPPRPRSATTRWLMAAAFKAAGRAFRRWM